MVVVVVGVGVGVGVVVVVVCCPPRTTDKVFVDADKASGGNNTSFSSLPPHQSFVFLRCGFASYSHKGGLHTSSGRVCGLATFFFKRSTALSDGKTAPSTPRLSPRAAVILRRVRFCETLRSLQRTAVRTHTHCDAHARSLGVVFLGDASRSAISRRCVRPYVFSARFF